MSTLVHLAALGATPTDTTITTVEFVAAAIAVIAGVIAFFKFRVLSGAQREDLEASAAQRAVEAMKEALDRYVADLHQAQADILKLEEKLAEANQLIATLREQLSDSKERIVRLEEQASHLDGDRSRLQERLDRAYKERARLELDVEQLRATIVQLERRVGGRRQSDEPETPSKEGSPQ